MQGSKVFLIARGQLITTCCALLAALDMKIRQPLWCQNASSERTDSAAELSLELHCGVSSSVPPTAPMEPGNQAVANNFGTEGHQLLSIAGLDWHHDMRTSMV